MLQSGNGPPTTTSEMIDRYQAEFCSDWYQRLPDRDGRRTPSGQAANVACQLERLREVAGGKPPADLRAEDLCAVQELMLTQTNNRGEPLTRDYINRTCETIRLMLKRCAAPPRRWVPLDVIKDMQLVEPLQRGRSAARESTRVQAVSIEHYNATIEQLAQVGQDPSQQFWALRLETMLDIQRWTGMRPGELCALHVDDLSVETVQLSLFDRPVELMVYRPLQHKGRHHGFDRVIFIGPLPRRRIADWMRHHTLDDGRLFGYTAQSYQQALRTFNRRHGLPHWSTNQVRHLFATEIRAESGIDVVQVLMGHQHLSTTEIYARPKPAAAIGAIFRYAR